jgi:hypothetical protein
MHVVHVTAGVAESSATAKQYQFIGAYRVAGVTASRRREVRVHFEGCGYWLSCDQVHNTTAEILLLAGWRLFHYRLNWFHISGVNDLRRASNPSPDERSAVKLPHIVHNLEWSVTMDSAEHNQAVVTKSRGGMVTSYRRPNGTGIMPAGWNVPNNLT